MKPTYEELEQQLAESHRALRAETTAHDHVKMHLEKMAAENVGLKEYLAPVWLAVEGTPATDAFLAEVRAQGVDMAMEHMQSSGSLTFGDCYISLNEFAAELRKGGNQ